MIITLTDKDGVCFDIDALIIKEVHGSPKNTELVLSTGEKIYCLEPALTVMKMIINAELGGKA